MVRPINKACLLPCEATPSFADLIIESGIENENGSETFPETETETSPFPRELCVCESSPQQWDFGHRLSAQKCSHRLTAP